MRTFGLIGKHLTHSFSPAYFAGKFEKEGITDCCYQLFPLSNIEAFELLIKEEQLAGLNVTIPYKTAIMPFLDALSPQATAIGAVNTINFEDGKLIGHNTDVYGFQTSLEKQLTAQQRKAKALVLGTGGASKAVVYALESLGMAYTMVSRSPKKGMLDYEAIKATILEEHLVIINTTPLGMTPEIESYPQLPYEAMNDQHLLYDLVYNPAETQFMKKGKAQGAATVNGLEMLHLQAEKAWAIWNKKNNS